LNEVDVLVIEERTGFLILAALTTFPVFAYFISKRWRSSFGSRLAQVALALLLALVAYVGTFGYAIDGLRDFRNPQVPFSLALVGNIIVWSVCLGAWVFAARFLILCFRKR
jgi:hypothetical protein